jgi:parvulin-like peptidyl-prolyl isomerase
MKTFSLPLASLVVCLAASAAGQTMPSPERAVPSHAVAGAVRPPAHEVVRVNGVPLMSSRLDAAVSSLIPAESFHRNVSAEKMAALRQRTLQTLVDEELKYQDGVRRMVKVSPVEVETGLAQAAKRYGGRRTFEEALLQSGASMVDTRREIRRTITIKKVSARTVGARCEVSRDEAARFFRANPDRFVEPEQLHIYAITLGVNPSSTAQQWADARSRAAEARGELEAGASFEDIALKYSTDPSKTTGGDMGLVHRGSLSDTFEQVAKDLPLGRPSGVIETLYGYHIVRVSEVRPPQKKTFVEVATGLRKDLTAKRCAELNEAWVSGLRARATVVFPEAMR